MQQLFDLPARHALDNNTLRSAAIAAEDSNSRLGPFQKSGEKFAEGLIGAIFDCRRGKPDPHGTSDYARDFIAAGARLDANRKSDSAGGEILRNLQMRRRLQHASCRRKRAV